MIIFIFSQIILGVLSLNCTDDQVIINSLCVFNDVTPLNSSTSYEGAGIKFKFSFEFPSNLSLNSTERYITMMIRINTPYWFAFGLGTGMTQADIWLFQIDPINKIISVSDCFGQNYTGPSYDIDYDGVENIIILGYTYDVDGITTVKFKRLLETNDSNDYVITQEKSRSAILAYGSDGAYDLEPHGSGVAKFSFDFVDLANTVTKPPFNWFPTHRWINLLCWGILIDFPIIIVRYFKTYSWYLNVHGLMMLLITFATLFGEITMSYYKKTSFEHDAFVNNTLLRQTHLVFGTIATILVTLQIILGIFLRQQIISKTTHFSTIKQQKFVHMVSGSLIYIVAKIQLFIGIKITGVKDLPLLYLVLGFTLVWRVLFEVGYTFYKKQFMVVLKLEVAQKSITDNAFDNSSGASNLIQHITQLDFKAISREFPGKKWAIFNNSVIDLSQHNHPGGQYLWEEVQGREISRFIYGAYCLESTNIAPNKHSEYALKLLEKLTIGQLVVAPLFSVDQTEFATWDIDNQQDLTPNIKLFNLTRKGVTFSTALNGFENFGRYFLVRSNSNKDIATRPYTMILCMAKCNQEYRKQMIQKAIARLSSSQGSQDNINEGSFVLQDQCDQLPLMIKRYPSKNGFSQYIHAAMIGDQIQLSGPFGTSFGIQHEQKGSIVIVAGGTGIFPFLDLLDFLLKKTLYQLYKEKNYDTSEVNPSKIDFAKYFQNQNKFILLFSVRSMCEMVGSDIYLTLAKIQKYLKQPNFELIFNYTDQNTFEGVQCIQNRFDHFFIHEKILNTNDVQKFLLSGPPSMNREISLGLQSLGLSKDKIHLV